MFGRSAHWYCCMMMTMAMSVAVAMAMATAAIARTDVARSELLIHRCCCLFLIYCWFSSLQSILVLCFPFAISSCIWYHWFFGFSVLICDIAFPCLSFFLSFFLLIFFSSFSFRFWCDCRGRTQAYVPSFGFARALWNYATGDANKWEEIPFHCIPRTFATSSEGAHTGCSYTCTGTHCTRRPITQQCEHWDAKKKN